MAVAVRLGPRAAVGGRGQIALVPAVLGPLPDIAEHAVEPERIGLERIDLGEDFVIIGAAAAIAVRAARADFVAPPARRCRAAARGEFPLGFARQAIGTLAVRKLGP